VKVLLLGDAHGNWDEVDDRLRAASRSCDARAGIQVGDLGIDRRAIRAFASKRGRFALPLYVVDGNHDDHAYLARAMRNGERQRWATEMDFHLQPRPSVVEMGGVKVGFLGGALHVALPQRHGLLSGAPNYVAKRHALAAAKLFDAEHPALIVTHSCPSGIGIQMQGHPDLKWGVHEHIVRSGFDPGPEHDRGEPGLRVLWDHMSHRPRLWIFGHFHEDRRVSVGTTDFASLDAVAPTRPSRLICWDTESMALVDG
jgi:predicted phosphodiesterase